MLNYIIRRLLLLIPMTAGMVVVTFALLLIIPGDPAAVLLGQEATPEAIATLRSQMGLDNPWFVRLWDYAAALLQGDMGQSWFQNQPVATVIGERLGATIELAIVSLAIATLIGVTLGVVAAVRQGSIIDMIAMLFAQIGVSMPVYWLGLLLMLGISVKLGWLPAVGRGAPIPDAVMALFQGRPDVLLDSLRHLALPALALALNSAAIISRLARSAMLEVLREDFVRTAKAKGLPARRIVYRHALRNALMPILSVIGLRFGALLGGAVLTESIFAWPGLGQLTVTAISQRDFPLIQGIVLTFALIFALINLVVDLLYAVVDPRVRLN